MTFISTSPWHGSNIGPVQPTLLDIADVGDTKLYRFPQEIYENGQWARFNWGLQRVASTLGGTMTIRGEVSAVLRNVVAVNWNLDPAASPTYPPTAESPATDFTAQSWGSIVQGHDLTTSPSSGIGGEIFTLDLGWQNVIVSVVATMTMNPWQFYTVTAGVPTFYADFRFQVIASADYDGNPGSSGGLLPFNDFDSIAAGSNSFDLATPAEFNETPVICRGDADDPAVNSLLTVTAGADMEIGQWRGNVNPL